MARISRGAQTPGNQAWKRVSFQVTRVEETSIADVLDENKGSEQSTKGMDRGVEGSRGQVAVTMLSQPIPQLLSSRKRRHRLGRLEDREVRRRR